MKLSTYEDYQESKDQLDAFENDINQQDQEEEEGKKKQGYEGEEVHDGKIALNAHYAAEVGEEKTKDKNTRILINMTLSGLKTSLDTSTNPSPSRSTETAITDCATQPAASGS